MSTQDTISDALENIITLANCWLKPLPDYNVDVTQIYVQYMVNDVRDITREALVLGQADYLALMHETSLLLRDWLKFEYHSRLMLDSGISDPTMVKISVADLKDPKDPSKTPTYFTPMRVRVPTTPRKSMTIKIPYGHLMAHCEDLESSARDENAATEGKIELDEHGKIARFEYPVDLRRYLQRSRRKFKDSLVDYIRATLGRQAEA